MISCLIQRDQKGHLGSVLNFSNFLIASLTLVGLISIQPFFIWNHSKVYYLISTLILCFAYLGYIKDHYKLIQKKSILFICICLIFLMYLTILPKVNHQHVRWIFLTPFIVAYFTLPETLQKQVFKTFYWVFLLSLVPGMILSCLMALGFSPKFSIIPTPIETFAKRGVFYLYFPGAMFLNNNSIWLPNGGFLSRLCGIWGEPGTVGTIAALLLAAEGFQMKKVSARLLFIAGFLSFSMAFFILFIVGFCFFSLLNKRYSFIIYGLFIALGVQITLGIGLGGNHVNQSKKSGLLRVDGNESVSIISLHNEEKESDLLKNKMAKFIKVRGALRTSVFDDRSSTEMNTLFIKYLHSDLKTILFGIASDASDVYGGESRAIWKIVFTNYGVIGFFLLVSLFFYYAYLFANRNHIGHIFAFVFLFFLSFYQRPVIWMPFYFIIFSGGIATLSSINSRQYISFKSKISASKNQGELAQI
ncbi:hypothetical protein Ltuc_0081 [Legionella tucsonensis]|uniref:Uncharacterized protein n=2 Tax=Legionella tucsonensis TaxID=40335 RepID=A0A0W0ZT58_9GAMM|nr:hypothetical protein Ltuc_0081 [Legionella tucsonensis]